MAKYKLNTTIKATGELLNILDFPTKEECEDYIQKIWDYFPEMAKMFDFDLEKEETKTFMVWVPSGRYDGYRVEANSAEEAKKTLETQMSLGKRGWYDIDGESYADTSMSDWEVEEEKEPEGEF